MSIKFYKETGHGNCIAVLTDHKANLGMVNALSAVFFVPDSAVNYGEVSKCYLARNCEPITEKEARKIHPNLFLRLDQKENQ